MPQGAGEHWMHAWRWVPADLMCLLAYSHRLHVQGVLKSQRALAHLEACQAGAVKCCMTAHTGCACKTGNRWQV